MTTKTATPLAKITRQSLPVLMKDGPGWDPRITKYLSKDQELKKIRTDPTFTAKVGPRFEIGGFRVQEIGTHGSIESGVLERVVQVTEAEGDEIFPDVLGDLCEDSGGPLGEAASSELRERFDRARFEFGEYSLIGVSPVLVGNKKRRDQLRIVNYLARAVAGADKKLARLFAQMLADNIENLEPPADL